MARAWADRHQGPGSLGQALRGDPARRSPVAVRGCPWLDAAGRREEALAFTRQSVEHAHESGAPVRGRLVGVRMLLAQRRFVVREAVVSVTPASQSCTERRLAPRTGAAATRLASRVNGRSAHQAHEPTLRLCRLTAGLRARCRSPRRTTLARVQRHPHGTTGASDHQSGRHSMHSQPRNRSSVAPQLARGASGELPCRTSAQARPG
jgi:hypothetical protein